MAFPVVEARATGRTTAANVTSHPITLPSGIVAGDLLLVVFACDGNPTISVDTGASGTGWNELTQGANGTTVSSNVFWKIAEGSDALTLTTSAGEQSSHASLRISGGYSVTGTSANGSSTNSNPPNHAGHDGTQDYLWIATRAGDSTVVATVAPTNFGNLQTLAAAGTAGASVNTAERSVNSASQDPGTFTSASEQWVSFTIAVSPVVPPLVLTAPLLDEGDTFFAATVELGQLVLTAPLLNEADTFFPATVVQGGGGPGPLTYGSYLWANAFSTDTATFAGMDIGPADADRWVIAAVLVNHNTSREVGTVTIGGVSATQLYEAPTLSASGITMSWWKAAVPTGTTANVVVTTSAGIWYDGACATYYCIGEPTFHDGAHDATYTGTTFEVAVDVPEGGAVLALVRNDGAGSLSGWSGATVDHTSEADRVYVASEDQLSAQSGRAVSWTGTAQSSVTGFYGLAVLSVSVPGDEGGGITLTAPLLNEGDTFFPATVTLGPLVLAAPLLNEGDTFYPATVSLGSLVLTTPLVNEGDTFFSATVSLGPLVLTAPLLNENDTFFSATVELGPLVLSAPLLNEGDTFFPATVVQEDPGTITLTAPLLNEGDTFFPATVTLGPLVLAAPLLNEGDTFYPATVSLGPLVLTTPLVNEGDTFFPAQIVLGPVTLTTPFLDEGDTFFPATVALGQLVLTTPFLDEGDTFYPAQIVLGPVTLTLPFLDEGDMFFPATIVQAGVVFPGRAAFPGASRTGGALTGSERGGRVMRGPNGGTLIRG